MKAKSIRKKLYHYCSIETFNIILKKKCLRLSDLSKTNDYTERKWSKSLVEEVLIEFFKANNISIDLREDYFYTDGVYNHIQYILSEIDMYIEYPSFITCFSRKGDLLSQWRAYAEDGQGVAIGFDSKIINKIRLHNSKIKIGDVIYNGDKQKNTIANIADAALDHFKEFMSCSDDIFDETLSELLIEELEIFTEEFASMLSDVSCIMKNPAFSEEKETRIYYNSNIYEDAEYLDMKDALNEEREFNNFILKPIDFNTKNNRVVGYMDLSFEKLIEHSIINEVIIGPSAKFTEQDIKLLLVKNGFDIDKIEIKKSEETYQIR